AAAALRRWWQLDPQGRAALPHPLAPFRKLLARSLLRSRQPEEAQEGLQALLEAGPDPEAARPPRRCFLPDPDWKAASALLEHHPSYRAENPLDFEPAPYVGERRCAACHRPQYEAVIASRHATTFARARELASLPLPRDPLPDPGNPQVAHQV